MWVWSWWVVQRAKILTTIVLLILMSWLGSKHVSWQSSGENQKIESMRRYK